MLSACHSFVCACVWLWGWVCLWIAKDKCLFSHIRQTNIDPNLSVEKYNSDIP